MVDIDPANECWGTLTGKRPKLSSLMPARTGQYLLSVINHVV